jgi:hypothetical protein
MPVALPPDGTYDTSAGPASVASGEVILERRDAAASAGPVRVEFR